MTLPSSASMFSRAVTEAKADRDRALDERDAAQDACSLAELEVKKLREELEYAEGQWRGFSHACDLVAERCERLAAELDEAVKLLSVVYDHAIAVPHDSFKAIDAFLAARSTQPTAEKEE